MINDDLEFNKNNDDYTIYVEGEVDYIIDMMKFKYKEFKRSEIIRPFYLKANQTLNKLLDE